MRALLVHVRARYGGALTAAAAALGLLAIGIAAVWAARTLLDVNGDAFLVAVLIAPLVLFLVLTGRVQELTAGGVSVKLVEARLEPVGRLTDAVEAVAADIGVRRDPTALLLKTNPNRPVVVTLKLGDRSCHPILSEEGQANELLSQDDQQYHQDQVLRTLREQAEFSPVPLLVVLDSCERVLAYASFRSALDLLASTEGERFINLVNGEDPNVFTDGGGFSSLRNETLPGYATNEEALLMMEQTGLDALVVVDRQRRFEGIVERSRLVSRMVLVLVSKETPAHGAAARSPLRSDGGTSD